MAVVGAGAGCSVATVVVTGTATTLVVVGAARVVVVGAEVVSEVVADVVAAGVTDGLAVATTGVGFVGWAVCGVTPINTRSATIVATIHGQRLLRSGIAGGSGRTGPIDQHGAVVRRSDDHKPVTVVTIT